MASTYSTNLALELIGTGDQAGTWGVTTNTNLGTLLEQAISGYVTQAVSTGTDTTITIPNGSTGVARNMYIELTGTGGTNTNLIVPANKKLYFIFNNASGAVTVKVSGQTGVSVPTGKKMLLVSNGTDIVNGVNYIQDFGTNSFTVTNLTATSATITNLIATTATVSDLSATVLRAASASITNLALTSLTISSLSITNVSVASATVSSNLTLSGGTANGVLYLNGSKVATSGSALTFDGTNLNLNSGTAVGVTSGGAVTAGAFTARAPISNHQTAAGILQYTGNEAAIRVYGSTGNTGQLAFNLGAGGSADAEYMRLTSTTLYTASGINVGIGTSSPAAKLEIRDSNATAIFSNSATRYGFVQWENTGGELRIGTDGVFGLRFDTNAQRRMTLDTSGNLGLGVTPSAWETTSSSTAFQFNGSYLYGYRNVGLYTGNNAYYDGAWKYYASSRASTRYDMAAGTFAWNIAPAGTAGDAISFTTAMTLDASGNLLVGTTLNNSYKAHICAGNSGNTVLNALAISNLSNSNGTGTGVRLIWKLSAFENAVESRKFAAIDAIGDDGNNNESIALRFFTQNSASGGDPTERARITGGGLFLVNATTSSGFGDGHRIFRDVAENTTVLSVDGGTEFSAQFRDVASGGYSTAGTAIIVGKNSSTSRSINAGGTVNASGADYAEYMEKAGDFVIAKGDVCGVGANGKLTNVYANAVAFVVKSTNPSYVGGDSWGAGYKDDPEGLEAARQKVDRIAFSGQVPVNVLGATPGQYIVPVNDNGAIKGMTVSNPSFEQYQMAIGKVIAIEDDGRARIIVKIA